MPLFPLLLIVLTSVVMASAVRQLLLKQRNGVDAAPEERVVTRLRWASLLLGLLIAWLVSADADALGRNLVLAPVAFSITLLAGSALAELLVRPWYAPGPRQADLTPRSPLDHFPKLFTAVVATTGGWGAALSTWAILTASNDDMGRAGRSYAYSCSPVHSGARGPFPGSYYATPYLLGLAVALVLALAAAVVITRRSLGGTPEQARRHRDIGVGAVVAALGVAVSAPLAGLSFFAATTVLGAECAPTLDRVIGWSSAALCVLSLVTLAISLGHLFVGGAPATPQGRAHRKSDSHG